MLRTLYGHLFELTLLPIVGGVSLVWKIAPQPLKKLFFQTKSQGLPIVLVPGYGGDSSTFIFIAQRLSNAGIGPFVRYRYQPLLTSIESHATRLEKLVDQTIEKSGKDKVILIGHSMGGIVARYFVQEMSGLNKVEKLVTVESPHQGLAIGKYAPGECAKQLTRDSHLLASLRNNLESLKALPILSIYSDINPFSKGSDAYHLLDNDSDHFIPGYGHVSLLYNNTVAKSIIHFLHH